MQQFRTFYGRVVKSFDYRAFICVTGHQVSALVLKFGNSIPLFHCHTIPFVWASNKIIVQVNNWLLLNHYSSQVSLRLTVLYDNNWTKIISWNLTLVWISEKLKPNYKQYYADKIKYNKFNSNSFTIETKINPIYIS